MTFGPIECKTYSCIECEKRDDIWCNELNCCLDIWLHPKANCPYLIHVVANNVKVVGGESVNGIQYPISL